MLLSMANNICTYLWLVARFRYRLIQFQRQNTFNSRNKNSSGSVKFKTKSHFTLIRCNFCPRLILSVRFPIYKHKWLESWKYCISLRKQVPRAKQTKKQSNIHYISIRIYTNTSNTTSPEIYKILSHEKSSEEKASAVQHSIC